MILLLSVLLSLQDGAPPPGPAAKPSPLSGPEQKAGFTLPPGFEIDLVASEPDAPKVVDVAFDDSGRMWALTATEYPVDGNESPAAAAELYKRGGRDRVLVFDAPGAAPRVFADGLAMPMAVLPYRDGALIGHGPEILFLRDTDGDGKADKREVVLTGFGIQDSHLLPHRFVRGPGGWIYLAQGAFNGSRVKSKDGRETPFDQCKVGRFKPDGSTFEVVGWGLNNIWGFVIDPSGNFWIQEANDLGYPLVPFKPGASYPGIGMHRAKPYAPWEPPLASFRMGGTGLSGLALAENFGAWSGAFLLANPITRRVNGIRAHPDGRLEKLPDFLLSSDEWFRPVAIHVGPDSAVYVVDWYNKIISHNEVPRNHPERDKVRGRVWRIRSTARPAVREVAKTPDAELPALLSSGAAWEARAARNQIVDRAAKALAPALAGIAKSGPLPARLLAMDALDQLGERIDDALLRDPEAAVRRDAVRILKSPLLDDPDPRVREESIRAADVALLLRSVKPAMDGPTQKCEQGGVLALTGAAHDRAFERYLIRSRLETLRDGLAAALADPGLKDDQRLFGMLALEEKDAAIALSTLIEAKLRAPSAEETAVLTRHPRGTALLARLLGAPEFRRPTLEALHAVRQRFDAAPLRDALAAAVRAEPELLLDYATAFRLAALEADVVALLPSRTLPALKALREMRAGSVAVFKTYATAEDVAVRREAVAALAGMDGGESALLELWPTLTPVLRKVAVDGLAGSKARAAVLAQAVKDGRISADDLDAATRDKLAAVLGTPAPAGPVLLRLEGKEEDWIPTAIDLDGPFTVECWLRLDAGISNADGLLGRPGGADFNFYDSKFRLFAGGGDRIIAKRAMVAGAWTHVAITRDAKGALRIYLDGEPDAATGTWEGALDKLDVGRSGAAGGTKGEIAEYRVWKAARSAAEIREHHDLSISAHPDLRFSVPFGKPWPSANRAATEPPPILSEAESRALRAKLEKFRALSEAPGDATSGQAVFGRACKTCHTLRGEGASIGPNLDGIGLRDPENLLRAIVTPSAAVEPGYRLFRARTKDGDVIDGLLVREDANELVIRPANAEELRLPRVKVAVGAFTRFSVMPEGLLETLPPKEVSDLFAYVKSAGRPLDPVPATPENVASFFNGKDLTGWDGNTSLWRVEAGEIVGRTDTGIPRNEFLRSRLVVGDFRLSLKVKLVRKNKGFENSGIQIRSQALPDGEMKGYQADIGPGWWGKLYEEHGRGLLWDKSGEAHVKDGEWNDYVVEAVGTRTRTFINGQACVDLDDAKGARSGLIAFQLHSGGPTEVRFKELRLELLPKGE